MSHTAHTWRKGFEANWPFGEKSDGHADSRGREPGDKLMEHPPMHTKDESTSHDKSHSHDPKDIDSYQLDTRIPFSRSS